MIARRAGAALAAVAVALLVVAEFTTVYEVTVGRLEVVKRSATGGENHGYALFVVALLAAGMTAAALRGARPPALALMALGVAALVITLAVDVPATRGAGGLPESLAYEDARARAGTGLSLALAGAVGLIFAGALCLCTSAGAERYDRSDPGAPPAA